MRRLLVLSALCLPATAFANDGGCVKGVNVDLTSTTDFKTVSIQVADANIDPNDITEGVKDNVGKR